MFPTKGEGLGSVFYGRLSVARERKASCVTRALSVIVPLRSPLDLGAGFFFSVPPTKRDRYPRLYYKYTCNSVSSPTVFSLYTSAIVRLSMCLHSRHNACSRCAFVLGHSRYDISTYTDILLGGNRLREASEAQPFSYRFVSLRSFSPPRPSVARARARRARTGH